MLLLLFLAGILALLGCWSLVKRLFYPLSLPQTLLEFHLAEDFAVLLNESWVFLGGEIAHWWLLVVVLTSFGHF